MSELDFGERPNVIPWPPLIYFAAMILAGALEYALPIRNLDALLGQAPVWTGAAVLALGFVIDLVAVITLRRHGTTALPHAGSKALCTTGIFGWSRNPIYVGNTIALVGLCVLLRWSWLLLIVPGTVTAIAWLAISREEAHLSKRFGHAFTVYCERVRRWL